MGSATITPIPIPRVMFDDFAGVVAADGCADAMGCDGMLLVNDTYKYKYEYEQTQFAILILYQQ